jgi:RNA polymerase sigma-70 factor (ECF subfamily)
MADDLADILAGCKSQDGDAQRRLYDRFHQPVYRLAARLVGRHEAADVTQEVFLRIFTRLGTFQGQASFTTWLYRVAANECFRHLRRRPPPVPLVDEPVGETPGPDRQFEQADLLEQALAQLDGSLRAVFLLREVDGLSYGEIAAVVGIPTGTVGSQLNRARSQLQGFLRRIEQGHHDEL